MSLSTVQKRKLHELELNKGGVAFVKQRSIVKPNPTIILSLGGLGGKTINMLKGKFIEEIGSSDHIYFRALDTDKNDTDKISKIMSNGDFNPISGAYMDNEETITLYNPAMHKLLFEENIPQYISSWLNPALKGTILDNTGARQIRQIGRAMLVSQVVYNEVRDKLSTIINQAVRQANAINEVVDVIIIAGVSGGTGSGSIIDVSYMIHDIFNSIGFDSYHIAGYIYTPDAQFNEQGIKGNDAILLNLKRNGYAALKEIDYFMNIEELHHHYQLKLNTNEITSSKNIFSSCTLVSGYSQTGGINDLSNTIGRLTDQLMDMLTNITFLDNSGSPVQLAKSLLSNENAMLSAWFNNHPSRKLYHRYATYKYQVLGYTSIMVPRDEILAYCVNEIYEQVIEEFKNFEKLDKKIMDNIFDACHISDIKKLLEFAKHSNPRSPINYLSALPDQITKKMIKYDDMVAYDLACQLAQDEASKCMSAAFKNNLEDTLYDNLIYQIEEICDKYGPYMAIEAITHRISKNTESEPFSGIIEKLNELANDFDVAGGKALNKYRNGGKRKLEELADEAIGGIFTNHEAIDEYVLRCCQLANITKINSVLYPIIAQVLRKVASRINEYNNDIFNVYTSILDEIGSILNKDGQYLTEGIKYHHDGVTYYSLDILEDGTTKKAKLENYLKDFISKVDVDSLASNFINKMRLNRTKWIKANNSEDFDVVNEVRELMDECLSNNDLKNDIIEKFITIAYSPINLDVDTLNQIWDDNSPDSLKMQALTTAANEIYTLLKNGSKTLAQSSSLEFSTFTHTIYVGTLEDAPMLSKILSSLVTNDGNKPALSTAKNKFIMTTQYMSLPMYILKGMDEYNEAYVNNDVKGKHMDENNQNWARFPNPYTIDSVARDIASKSMHPDEIKKYPDYQILVDVKEKLDYALDTLGSAYIEEVISGGYNMYLYDIVYKPSDLNNFRESLLTSLKNNNELNYIEFMKNNGYTINKVMIKYDPVDLDLSIRSLDNINDAKYSEVPVPIADVYKWVRKSLYYYDILNKNNELFNEVYMMISEIKDNFSKASQYIDNVETFAHCIQTGMIKMKDNNPLVWNYMDGLNPVTVNMLASKKFIKTYYLYQVFVSFNSLSIDRLNEYSIKTKRLIERLEVVDYSDITNHIEEILSNDYLGDVFNLETINNEASEQGVVDSFMVTDRDEDKGNVYKVLKRFYQLLNNSL